MSDNLIVDIMRKIDDFNDLKKQGRLLKIDEDDLNFYFNKIKEQFDDFHVQDYIKKQINKKNKRM